MTVEIPQETPLKITPELLPEIACTVQAVK